MRNRTRTHTSHSIEIDGIEVPVEYAPYYEDYVLAERVGDKLVVAYLVHDYDYRDIEDMLGDGMGKLLSFHRHAPGEQHAEALEALGKTGDVDKDLDSVWNDHFDEAIERYIKAVLQSYSVDEIVERLASEYPSVDAENLLDELENDCRSNDPGNVVFYSTMEEVLETMWEEPAYFPGNPDAVVLDCYDHGGQRWSVSGGGMQCRWDTARGAGVWVPDKVLVDQLNSDEAGGLNRAEQAVIYCKQFLSEYNAIISGDVYGCVVETFTLAEEGDDQEWEREGDEEACWGFIGSDHAMDSLRTEFFEPALKAIKESDREEA